jgi:hypothetical protein
MNGMGMFKVVVGGKLRLPVVSAFGTKRTSRDLQQMSAFGGKANMTRTYADVCF